MSSQYRTLVKIVAAEGKADELTRYVLGVIPQIRKVDGLLSLEPNVDEKAPDTLYLYYAWESREKEAAYIASEFCKGILAGMAPLRQENLRIQLRRLD